MNDTPRTDLAYKNSTGAGIYELFKEAQEIERELTAANSQIGLLIAGSKQQERQIEFLKETIQKLHKGAFEQQEHIAELENRLRAKFNKSEEDSKHYCERIQRLIEAGNALLKVVREDEGLSFTDWVDLVRDAETSWTKAKEGL